MRACNGLRSVVDCLPSAGHPLGLISGLAMPHYEGRLVILDADFAEAKAGFGVEEFICSNNTILPGGGLRRQLSSDSPIALSPTVTTRRFFWA